MKTRNLELRLKRLERRNSLLLVLLIGLGLLFLIGGGGDKEISQTIRCQRLEVVDEVGKVVAAIGVDAEGSRGLFINDSEERLRLAAIHDETQTAVYHFDTTGTIRIGIAQYAHGGGGVALHGPEARGAAVLYLKETGSLSFYGDDGTVLNQVSGVKE